MTRELGIWLGAGRRSLGHRIFIPSLFLVVHVPVWDPVIPWTKMKLGFKRRRHLLSSSLGGLLRFTEEQWDHTQRLDRHFYQHRAFLWMDMQPNSCTREAHEEVEPIPAHRCNNYR